MTYHPDDYEHAEAAMYALRHALTRPELIRLYDQRRAELANLRAERERQVWR